MSRDVQAPAGDDAPDTRELADALGVQPRRLLHFVDHHPDPEAVNILGWAVADPALESDVAAWLDAREERERGRSP